MTMYIIRQYVEVGGVPYPEYGWEPEYPGLDTQLPQSQSEFESDYEPNSDFDEF